MENPSLSVGLPVFNAEGNLRRAVASVLSQDWEDLELVICDNASTDATPKLCAELAAADPRVRYFRNERNIGVNPNHDRVYHLSRGRNFLWMADDVEMLPGMLRRCVSELEKGAGSVVLVHPLCEVIENGTPLPLAEQGSVACADPRPHRRLTAVIRWINRVNQLYGVMRRDVLAKTRLTGLYPSSDYVLLAELAMLGEIREIPEVLLRRRVDAGRGTAAVYGDARAWRRWLAPEVGRRGLDWLPIGERVALEYVRSAWRLPLPWRDRLPCMLTGPAVHYWRILLRFTGPMRHRWRRQVGRAEAGQ